MGALKKAAAIIKYGVTAFIVIVAAQAMAANNSDQPRIFGSAAMSIFIVFCIFYPLEQAIKRREK